MWYMCISKSQSQEYCRNMTQTIIKLKSVPVEEGGWGLRTRGSERKELRDIREGKLTLVWDWCWYIVCLKLNFENSNVYLGRPYGVPVSEPRSVRCKANSQPILLMLCPYEGILSHSIFFKKLWCLILTIKVDVRPEI